VGGPLFTRKPPVILPDWDTIPAWEFPPLSECRHDSANILARCVALLTERERVRLRRAAGLPREQWTNHPLLSKFKFTNIRPADDRVSRWFQEWLGPHIDKPYVWFLAVVHVLLNWPDTEEALGWLLPFNEHVERFIAVLEDRKTRGKRNFNTPAYSIKQTPQQVAALLLEIWNRRDDIGPRPQGSCIDFANWLMQFRRMGPFLAAQVLLHIKAPLMPDAVDYKTFALRGPSSSKLLCRVKNLPLREDWELISWYREHVGFAK
jgi:hypothetical protein